MPKWPRNQNPDSSGIGIVTPLDSHSWNPPVFSTSTDKILVLNFGLESSTSHPQFSLRPKIQSVKYPSVPTMLDLQSWPKKFVLGCVNSPPAQRSILRSMPATSSDSHPTQSAAANPVCGFSMMEQVRLCSVWPMENWLGSSMNHIQGSRTV